MATPKKSSKAPAKSAEKSAEKSASKSAESAAQPAITINPANSAQSVAAALAARARQNNAAPAADAKQGDSNSFKKFKEGIAKPQFSATSPLAGSGKPNKFGVANNFATQATHNQTAGANVTRTGVPRRTSGG